VQVNLNSSDRLRLNFAFYFLFFDHSYYNDTEIGRIQLRMCFLLLKK
jgi:hypothetical protein